MDEHSRNWILAQVPAIAPDDNVSFQKPSIEQIYQKLEGLAEMQKKGLFVPDREKDMLTAAIGTLEHPGRVRGSSLKSSPRGTPLHSRGSSCDYALCPLHLHHFDNVILATKVEVLHA
jgi:hypothetical protein